MSKTFANTNFFSKAEGHPFWHYMFGPVLVQSAVFIYTASVPVRARQITWNGGTDKPENAKTDKFVIRPDQTGAAMLHSAGQNWSGGPGSRWKARPNRDRETSGAVGPASVRASKPLGDTFTRSGRSRTFKTCLIIKSPIISLLFIMKSIPPHQKELPGRPRCLGGR